ncbi:MAG: histidine kinase dimerization/phospho-acceptor domain-containing protein [Cyanobacteria bacterium J06631_6]
MFDNSPLLKEFVSPIPICQPNADLGNMLSIFQHLNCKMLAIPQPQLAWGILRAEDLLSIVAEAWLGEGMSLATHPRNITYQQNITHRLKPDSKTSIRPARLYQGDLTLEEFLRQEDGPAFDEQDVCLIVDRRGELLGKLDRQRVIQYLGRTLLSTLVVDLPPPPENPQLVDFTDLLAEIALPSKVETATGQVIQANQLWQKLANNNNSTSFLSSSSPEDSLTRMTRCWIEEQELFCSEHALEKNLTRSFEIGDQDHLEIKVVKADEWNLLRIPLITKHYLVVATPIIEAPQSGTKDLPAMPEAATHEILGTVSHELKSPLTGIVGLSSLLKGQKLGVLNQRQARYVDLIYRSGKKMMNIVDDLLQLTTFAANQEIEPELINLEFLCRQLYQQVLARVELLEPGFSATIELIQPQLKIKSGSEIAIANKVLLSAVLTHLILEVFDGGRTPKPLKIEITSRAGLTAIIISSQESEALAASNTSAQDFGFNLTIAKYLARLLEAKVSHDDSLTNPQLILLLPKSKIPQDGVTESPASISAAKATNLTILCLYPELEVVDPHISDHHNPNFDLKSWSDSYGLQNGSQHRIIEADSLEQAHNLARIWRLDAIVLNGYQIAQPDLYLRSLQRYHHLATLPLITLDTRTTEAANQIEGLNIYPCLLPAQQCRVEDLIQVIQIAIES